MACSHPVAGNPLVGTATGGWQGHSPSSTEPAVARLPIHTPDAATSQIPSGTAFVHLLQSSGFETNQATSPINHQTILAEGRPSDDGVKRYVVTPKWSTRQRRSQGKTQLWYAHETIIRWHSSCYVNASNLLPSVDSKLRGLGKSAIKQMQSCPSVQQRCTRMTVYNNVDRWTVVIQRIRVN